MHLEKRLFYKKKNNPMKLINFFIIYIKLAADNNQNS